MSTTVGGVRIVDMPDLGAVTSGSSFVGERAGSGRFGMNALYGYLLPLLRTDLITSPPMQDVDPVANDTIATKSAFVCQSSTQSESVREWLAVFGLINNKGQTHSGVDNLGDNVTLYAGMDCEAGAGDAWTLNTCLNMLPGSGTYAAQGYELDFNNWLANRGSATGVSGMLPPVAYGLSIAAGSTYSSTAAIAVNGPSLSWYRGIAFNVSCVYAAISDYSHATYGIEMNATHTYGIDMSGSTQGTALRTGNNQAISARNAANSADITMIRLLPDNTLWLGIGAAAITVPVHVLPSTDNAFTLGTSGDRFSAVWAANGTIQTSDPALKTDIQPLPSMLSLVTSVNPITFRWKDGGGEVQSVREEQTVHATEMTTHDVQSAEVVNGSAVAVTKQVQKAEPLFDELPVTDATGAPVYDDVVASDGSVRKVPRIHREPRMVTQMVDTLKPVAHAGQRTHWGFSAPDLKAAFDALGMDFGGYVQAEDGTHNLRPDQLIPVLWKAFQELSAKVAALEAASGV